MSRGRKAKPIERQIADGDTRKRGVHKLDEQKANIPVGDRGLPECPEMLQGRAREAWDFWKAQLEGMEADYTALALTLQGGCILWHQYCEAYEALNRQGRTVFNDKGNEVNHPANARLNASWTGLKAFCSDNGLTLVSRGRIDIPRQDRGAAELSEIFTRPRERKAQVQ